MSLTTFKIKDEVHTYKHRFLVASGAAATIGIGVPTKVGSAGAIVPMVDGNGTTSERFTGIGASVSTDTASAAGEVYVWEPFAEVVYEGSPLVTTGANTQAKIDALQYKCVPFDLTAAAWTIDSAASNAATNCVIIVGGQYQDSGGTLYFSMMSKGVYLYA